MSAPDYEKAAALLRDAERVIAVTGAGVSVESGIPDFRSADGLWTKYPPEQFASIDAFMADPDRVWTMWHELGASLAGVEPNPAHYALAELERLGKLQTVITQNIDNLHTAAGSTGVIEYHGNAAWMYCLECGVRKALEISPAGRGAPRCACGGVMKPDVIFFGEGIPQDAMLRSDALARRCDAVIVAGTSATVYPAAGLPEIAKQNGAAIIECNIEATGFTGGITDVFLEGPAGTTLPALLEALRRLLEGEAR